MDDGRFEPQVEAPSFARRSGLREGGSAGSPSGIRNPHTFLLLFALLLGTADCAARRQRSFAHPAETQASASLAAWRQAVERAESMPRGRLLYEARLTQGLVSLPGTLAVRQSPGVIEASLTGPFGTPIATYVEGALRGEGIRPLAIAPEALRSLLAGAWQRGEPEVIGVDGSDALLAWTGEEQVEGILDVPQARFRSLAISRVEGKILSKYSGDFDPWPTRIEVQDARTGAKLRLTLIGRE
ncbi:MAG TPA: hypothetical protein VK780_10505 [Thermoanaerobaculia bacterium]|nr:hypothetical protein [Thermoanaerobaculia bacterium]